MSQPGFPDVGTLLYGGLVNGQVVWTQPNGPGTAVFPPLPTLYPAVPQGYKQTPFAFNAFLLLGCGHWINSIEVIEQYDPYNEVQAALCCCPACHYIQLIVEPADDWWNQFYSIYDTGLVEHLKSN